MLRLRIVASLVRAQPVPFLLNILRWLLVAIPATWTNSWLSYVQNKLALAYRTRLTEEVMKQYLGDEADSHDLKVFYKLGTSQTGVHPLLDRLPRAYSKPGRPYKEPRSVSGIGLTMISTRAKVLLRMITHDIQRFSTHLAAIYANVAKPVLDVILYNYQLSQNVGAEGLVLLTVLVQASAALRQYSSLSHNSNPKWH